MKKIFEHEKLLGAQRRSVLSNILIEHCIQKDSSFEYWINNKFLKYEYELIDDDDLRILDESVFRLVAEQLNHHIGDGNVGSIQEILTLVLQVRGTSNNQTDIGLSPDDLIQLSEGVDVKLSILLKILRALGLNVQISS